VLSGSPGEGDPGAAREPGEDPASHGQWADARGGLEASPHRTLDPWCRYFFRLAEKDLVDSHMQGA